MNKTIYKIFVFCFAIILLTLGTYIGFRISDKALVKETKVKKVENNDEIISVIQKVENSDIEVIYEDYYTSCNESIIIKNTEFGTTIDKIKEKTNKEYKVVEENKNNIKFKKIINSNCPNHFELKLENDFVVIYKLDSPEISTMYKNTEIPKSSLREEIIEELEKGIKLNTLEELNSIIEDIES
ncbi:MAG: hypothetical protein RR290_03785 [Clostridia bacterium]